MSTLSIAVWIQEALDATKAMVAKEVSSLNDNLVGIFRQGFDNWSAQVMSGAISNANPPKPPIGYASGTGADGFAVVIPGIAPVCAMPPIPSIPAAPAGMIVAIGIRIATTNFWTAPPPNGNIPIPYTTPTPVKTADGTIGFFAWVTDAGLGGWWEKIG